MTTAEMLDELLHLRHGWGVEIEFHRHNPENERYRLHYEFFAIGYRVYHGPTLESVLEQALAEFRPIAAREVTE